MTEIDCLEEVEILAEIPLRTTWNFTLEIEGAPEELDILVEDLRYDPVGIVLDTVNFGAQQVTSVAGQEAGNLIFTLKDTRDRKLYRWFQEWAGQVVHSDGTFGLPASYMKRVKVYSETRPNETESGNAGYDEYSMFVSSISGFTADRSSGKFFEFTVTLNELKSGVLTDSSI